MTTPILFYGQPFVISFAIASVLCFFIIHIFKTFKVKNRRNGVRHIHKQNISRFGGVAIIISFIIAIFLNKYLFFDHIVWSMIVGGIFILLIGVIDDIKPLSWKSQLFAQVIIILLIFIMGVRIEFITNPFGGIIWLIYNNIPIVSLLFMLVWMLVIMNAINWCDGIDGLSGGIVFIAAVALIIISLQPHVAQPPIAIIATIFAGSVAGFLIFNLPVARIFAGSSGSFFMGYVIALIAIAAGAKIGTTLLVLAVPLVDSVWVVLQRMRNNRSIFQGDKGHLHHKLLDRGWSVRRILTLYYFLTMLSAYIAVSTFALGKIFALIIFCSIVIAFFYFLSYGDKNKSIA